MTWQKKVVKSGARYKIIRAGRRTGKTLLIIIDSLTLATKYNGLSMAYVGLNYTHAKDVVWEDYIKYADKIIEYKNSQELLIRLKNGSRIRLYSWDSVDNMLGKKYHKVYLDEAAVPKNFFQAWDNVIEPTLLDYNGEAWFTSMPRGKGHFKKLIDDSKSKEDWQDFHFTSYDNEFIPNIKQELDNKRKYIAPSVFAQQYLAEFTDLENRIYTEFTRDDALKDIPFEPKRWGLCIDFGYNHPLAAYLLAISADNHVHVYKELYKRGLDVEPRKEAIKNLVEGYTISVAVADSEDPMAIKHLNDNLHLNIQPAIKGKGSVLEGINTVKSGFHSKQLTINERCTNLIDELETYTWKTDKTDSPTDEPIKENDDCVDSLRYGYTKIAQKQPIRIIF